ncbi:hypothetical protein IF1G_05932 [Cordyceps javanica]|uniref:Uncharacterized protein n=1 Tax=Cordyceps javanica TaxID=43265 RepID=A0A545UZP4_9HYPO|nr:hypothetical protein IF1G_05932 [Cordyceps javanica]
MAHLQPTFKAAHLHESPTHQLRSSANDEADAMLARQKHIYVQGGWLQTCYLAKSQYSQGGYTCPATTLMDPRYRQVVDNTNAATFRILSSV